MNPVVEALGKVLADLATAVSRRALAADPMLKARLEALQGSCLELRCTLPEAIWHTVVDDGSLKIVAGPADSPQARVTGTVIELGAWLLPGNAPTTAQVEGDEALFTQLREILQDFNPDAGPALSEILGSDVAADLLGAAELGLQGLRSVVDDMSKNGSSGGKPS